jgi:polysaccharide biosynthesis/export protein
MAGAQSTSTEALPFIDLTPVTVVAYGSRYRIDGPSTKGAPLDGRVSVAPGDQLRVRIFEEYAGGRFPTLLGGGDDLGIQQVTPD